MICTEYAIIIIDSTDETNFSNKFSFNPRVVHLCIVHIIPCVYLIDKSDNCSVFKACGQREETAVASEALFQAKNKKVFEKIVESRFISTTIRNSSTKAVCA